MNILFRIVSLFIYFIYVTVIVTPFWVTTTFLYFIVQNLLVFTVTNKERLKWRNYKKTVHGIWLEYLSHQEHVIEFYKIKSQNN